MVTILKTSAVGQSVAYYYTPNGSSSFFEAWLASEAKTVRMSLVAMPGRLKLMELALRGVYGHCDAAPYL